MVGDKPKHIKLAWNLQDLLLQDWNKYASSSKTSAEVSIPQGLKH